MTKRLNLEVGKTYPTETGTATVVKIEDVGDGMPFFVHHEGEPVLAAWHEECGSSVDRLGFPPHHERHPYWRHVRS